MAIDWEAKPPYPNWKSYASCLKKYADTTMVKYEKVDTKGLAAFRKKTLNETPHGVDSTPTQRSHGDGHAARVRKKSRALGGGSMYQYDSNCLN